MPNIPVLMFFSGLNIVFDAATTAIFQFLLLCPPIISLLSRPNYNDTEALTYLTDTGFSKVVHDLGSR